MYSFKVYFHIVLQFSYSNRKQIVIGIKFLIEYDLSEHQIHKLIGGLKPVMTLHRNIHLFTEIKTNNFHKKSIIKDRQISFALRNVFILITEENCHTLSVSIDALHHHFDGLYETAFFHLNSKLPFRMHFENDIHD